MIPLGDDGGGAEMKSSSWRRRSLMAPPCSTRKLAHAAGRSWLLFLAQSDATQMMAAQQAVQNLTQ
jgi:hypothetical protein